MSITGDLSLFFLALFDIFSDQRFSYLIEYNQYQSIIAFFAFFWCQLSYDVLALGKYHC